MPNKHLQEREKKKASERKKNGKEFRDDARKSKQTSQVKRGDGN
jgi:hypothetical protein